MTVLRSRDGVLDDEDKRALSKLKANLASGRKKVLLFLHGGLVDQQSAELAAVRLAGKAPDGFGAADEVEQVYIVWRTGALETLRTNWRDIFDNDRLYKVLLKRLLSFLADKVRIDDAEGRSIGQGLSDAEIDRRLNDSRIGILLGPPFKDLDDAQTNNDGSRKAVIVDDTDLEDELRTTLMKDAALGEVASDIEAELDLRSPVVSRRGLTGDAVAGARSLKAIDNRITQDWETPAEDGSPRALVSGGIMVKLVKHGIAIGKRVIQRFKTHRDHGLHATIAEEIARELYGDLIGSIVWGMMTKDATDHFLNGKLGKRLLEIFAANSQLELVVVGHSAGSIWASDMLLNAAKSGAGFAVSMVFLAPAVRMTKFSKALDAYGDNVKNFRLFAMRDELEREDVLLGKGYGFLYPSSLLYLVSGLFENNPDDEAAIDAPLLGMERFLQEDTSWIKEAEEVNALQKVKAFLAAQPNRIVLSESSLGPGLNTSSKTHGDFDNDHPTIASIATYLA